jgi:nucleotide-binding universal stress UspA family protein
MDYSPDQAHAIPDDVKDGSLVRTAVVPLDGSPLAERALPYATQLARVGAVGLVLVRAHLPDDDRLDLRLAYPGLRPAERATLERCEAEAALIQTAERLRRAGLDAVAVFREGGAAAVLRVVAAETNADLIVMATHAEWLSGRFLLGSVGDELVRGTCLPVIMIPPRCQHGWHRGQLRVLVPLDGSPLAERAVTAAVRLVSTTGGELALLGIVQGARAPVLDPNVRLVSDAIPDQATVGAYLDGIASQLRASNISVTTHVSFGAVGMTVIKASADLDADLIAMATHGRSGLTRLIVGSAAREVLERADRPVLMVRPCSASAG